MAPLQVAFVNELSYRALVWLTYRLAATVALGLPLVLLVWSAWRREPVVQRLLGLYWKDLLLFQTSSLFVFCQHLSRCLVLTTLESSHHPY